MTVPYRRPRNWLQYDRAVVMGVLTNAKAAMLAVTQIPYQRSWAEQLQSIQLKREIAGTSRIEGADFTERELDAAMRESPENLHTRSQKQAAAAIATYRWISALPPDRPVDQDLILETHRRIVTGCDDDRCAPGVPRGGGQNVVFGMPRHRGVEGGAECAGALTDLCDALRTSFREQDPLIQALALHCHFAAMHPFLDGNGRTARALEALMLQRVGLRDTLFIAMSNYYYEEKDSYLRTLAGAGRQGHDLTPFLLFGLRGIESQCQRLFSEIRHQVEIALYRNTMTDLFTRLQSPRKRVVSGRHIQVMNLLLDEGRLSIVELARRTAHLYTVKNPRKALLRDLTYLLGIEAIEIQKVESGEGEKDLLLVLPNLKWPMQITETEFFRKVRALPKGKVHGFLSM